MQGWRRVRGRRRRVRGRKTRRGRHEEERAKSKIEDAGGIAAFVVEEHSAIAVRALASSLYATCSRVAFGGLKMYGSAALSRSSISPCTAVETSSISPEKTYFITEI